LEKKGRREKTLPRGALLSVKERERRRRCAPGPLAHGLGWGETGPRRGGKEGGAGWARIREGKKVFVFFYFFSISLSFIPKPFSKPF